MNNSSLQRLLQCVPPDTFNLANTFLDDIESVRFDSITRHRTITVLPIAMLPEDKYPKKFLPPQQEFIPHVLSRPVLTSHEVTPTFIQYASLLVNYVHKNIPLFARAMAVRMDKSDSHYLIYSVIPGLFGYFISHDHSSRAVIFYKAIMKIVPPDMASEIMKPFFTSVITYRFIESVMYPFIYRFLSDPTIIQHINIKSSLSLSSTNLLQKKSKSNIRESQSYNDVNENGFFSIFKRKSRNSFTSNSPSFSIINTYSKMLCDLIIQSIPLLPVEALEIIDLMYQRHWTQAEFNDFFFDNFFSYVSTLYICATPCLKAESAFKDVLACLKSLSLLNLKFFHKAYFEGMTRFEVPPLYSMLDLPYLDFALTIADIAVATNAIENISELPPSLQGISYSKFSKDKFFKMFAVRSFVRKYQVSELCLTMSPTQLANEGTDKKKNNTKKNKDDNPNSDSDMIYNFDDYDFGGCNYNSFYNLEMNPTKRPLKIDYNKEKSEMVVFNIKKLEVEENPEFERIFLQEHFSAENEEKSANDITIDLIERIGPAACNFNSINTTTDQSKQEKDASTATTDTSINTPNTNETEFKLDSNETEKIEVNLEHEINNNFNSLIDDFFMNSPSNEDLTIGRLAKELDSEPKKSSSAYPASLPEYDVEQIAHSQFGSNFINISKMLNENQIVGKITKSSNELDDNVDTNNNNNNCNNNDNSDTNKRARKKFNSKSTFSDNDNDDCFSHDGILNTTFSSQIKSAQTSACELSELPLDDDSLSTNTNNNINNTKTKNDVKNDLNERSLNIYLAKRRANLLIDQSHVFENYIRFRLASEQYSTFTSLLGDLESIICAPLAMNLATFARQKHQNLTVTQLYRLVEKFFEPNQLKRLIFFIVLSRGPKKCLTSLPIVSLINDCDKKTHISIEKVLKNLDISCETNKLHHGESEVFWRTVEALQVMKEEIPVPMQMEAFNYVLAGLRSVEESLRLRRIRGDNVKNLSDKKNKPLKSILKGNLEVIDNDDDLDFESLLFLALLTSSCRILPARYIIFQHFVEKENVNLGKLIGTDNEKNWRDFGDFLVRFTNLNDIDYLKDALDNLKRQLSSIDNNA